MKSAKKAISRPLAVLFAIAFLALYAPNSTTAASSDQNGDATHLSGDHSHITNLTELCEKGEYEKGGAIEKLCAELAATYYYKDTIDGGSDIFKPGCHLYYPQAGCPAGTGKPWSKSGDKCLDAKAPKFSIGEWTNPKCHGAKPVDSSTFDCNKECQKKGALTGTCVTVKNFCAKGIDSAKCECIFP